MRAGRCTSAELGLTDLLNTPQGHSKPLVLSAINGSSGMAVPQALLRLFRLRQPRLRSTLNLSALESLPIEILQSIAAHLPLSGASALALCSRTLAHALGTQHWDALREPKRIDDKRALLALLDPDLPDHILCASCAMLHRPYPNRFDVDYARPPRDCESGLGCNPINLRTIVYFNNVQAAMKRHRQGRDVTKELRALSSTMVDKFPQIEDPTSVVHTSVLPCIIDGEMLFRTQCRVFVKTGAPFPDLVLWWACAHQNLLIPDPLPDPMLSPMAQMLACRTIHIAREESACAHCTGIRQCPFCDTEYQIDHKVWAGSGTSLVVAAWSNMGSARSPSDPKWAHHVDVDFVKSTDVPRKSPETGALQRAFNAQKPWSVEESLETDFVPWLDAKSAKSWPSARTRLPRIRRS